jgi:hypothetical protein
MPDMFSTDSMLGVIEDLKVPSNSLLQTFFPEQVVEESEEIHFDVDDKRRRVAPFVSPLVGGKVVAGRGQTVKSFKPAYIKDKRVYDPNRPFKRAMGEGFGGTQLTATERMEMLLVQDIDDQMDMITRRMELMALEALSLGQVTVSGELYPTTVVNFGRHADLSPTALTSTARWGQSAAKPLTNLRTWAGLCQQKSGVYTRDVIMDPETLEAFTGDPTVAAKLDQRHVENVGLNVDQSDDEGLAYIGRINGFRIWSYVGWYVNDADAEVTMLPAGRVIMTSRRIDGIQAHGAIKDHDSLQALPYFPKSWTENDPSVRMLLMQSAPLVVPTRVNASLGVNVL